MDVFKAYLKSQFVYIQYRYTDFFNDLNIAPEMMINLAA